MFDSKTYCTDLTMRCVSGIMVISNQRTTNIHLIENMVGTYINLTK